MRLLHTSWFLFFFQATHWFHRSNAPHACVSLRVNILWVESSCSGTENSFSFSAYFLSSVSDSVCSTCFSGIAPAAVLGVIIITDVQLNVHFCFLLFFRLHCHSWCWNIQFSQSPIIWRTTTTQVKRAYVTEFSLVFLMWHWNDRRRQSRS